MRTSALAHTLECILLGLPSRGTSSRYPGTHRNTEFTNVCCLQMLTVHHHRKPTSGLTAMSFLWGLLPSKWTSQNIQAVSP